MKIIIGYAMRSGSTLLHHVLNQHSMLKSYSDISSIPILLKLGAGIRTSTTKNICVKPVDLVYLWNIDRIYKDFDKFLWIARDPRDSYLSSLESGYAYLFCKQGNQLRGLDVALIKRWKRIYRHYFHHVERWHLIRYEDFVTGPETILEEIFDYLELPSEKVIPFQKFNPILGGDYKLSRTSEINTRSIARFRQRLQDSQIDIFNSYLFKEMKMLGYS